MLINSTPPPAPRDDSRAALAEPPPAQGEIAVPAEPQPRSKRRWFGWLLLFGLVTVGYVNRAQLLGFVTGKTNQPAPAGERKILYWHDPMHPAYTSDKPGTAPDCGMDLVPVYADDGATSANLPPGAVRISAEKQQLIGVQYGEAAYQSVSKTLRAVGRVGYDETKVVRIHPRFEGWIEEVFADFTGKQVRRGEPLLSQYSPELWQTQQEFLLARRGRAELSESPYREVVNASAALYDAARRRLELWDINAAQIKELETSGQPLRAMLLYAPGDGFVLTRNAFPKQRVTPETELYVLADLSTVWVQAEVYEYEASEIKLGQTALLTLAAQPGRPLRGKVSNISPQLDSTTRTLKVRIEAPNPGFALKPEMFANVELKVDYGRHVIVPQEAVLDSGAAQTVFVARAEGYFEPRAVLLGAQVENNVIILNGLKAGERVVTSANFLIDSESRLKSATNGMGAAGHSGHGAQTAPVTKPAPASHQHETATPKPKSPDHSQHQAKAAAADAYWTCSMHPEIREAKPGRCPKCGMNLVQRAAGEAAMGGKQ
jgi:membrane fusion protein, copper/silver efflux system